MACDSDGYRMASLSCGGGLCNLNATKYAIAAFLNPTILRQPGSISNEIIE